MSHSYHQSSPSRPSSSPKKWLLGLFLLPLFGLGLAASFLASQLRPANSQQPDVKTFTIEAGEGIDSISRRLKQQGFIRNPLVFKATVLYLDLAQKIQAGDFSLSSAQTTPGIAQSLTRSKAQDISVTILEGWRREEIAAALAKAYQSHGLSFDAAEFLRLTTDKEGYLFPDTYAFAKSATPQQIIGKFDQNFAAKIGTPLAAQIQASPHTLEEHLIMASILEREARGEALPLVAGILWKRFNAGWPLQADATLQYAKGFDSQNQTWWPPPLAIDKEINSPYNTYQNTGLPPGPIGNPSKQALEASLNPIETNYWFYLTDNSGNMHYAIDYDTHLSHINTYLR